MGRVPKVLLEAAGAREEPRGRGSQETPREPRGARQLSQRMGYPAPRARAGLSPGNNHAKAREYSRKLQHANPEMPSPGDTVPPNPGPKDRLSQEDAHSQRQRTLRTDPEGTELPGHGAPDAAPKNAQENASPGK